MSINFWITRKEQKLAIKEINGLLSKFIGRAADPLEDQYALMRKLVIKYFTANPDHLKHFLKNKLTFDYTFEIEVNKGIIKNVKFKP